MLDPNLKNQLKEYLTRLQRTVRIESSFDDSEPATEFRDLLQEIRDCSDRIELSESIDTATRRPSFAIESPGHDISIRFAGVPLGHEFTSLVLALLQAGGHPPKLDAAVIEQVQAIEDELHFETYYSLSCQNCPDVVQALNTMAVLNPRVRHEAIDGALFQQEVEDREVMSVPMVFLNGKPFGTGRMGIEEILAKLDSRSGERQAKKLDAKDPFDMLIVGGGPAGAAAAIYAARKGIRTGVISERFGGQVLDTMGIENFISVSHTEGPRLAAQLEAHVREHDVDIMNVNRASQLQQTVQGFDVTLENGATLSGKSVVLATGARWRQMNVPGEDEYRNKGVAYCPHCDGPLFRGKRVAVIGGGNSGVEAAIDLAGIVSHVTLLEFDHQLRADDVLQRKLRSLDNVKVLTAAQTTEVLGDGKRVTGLKYTDHRTEKSHDVELEGIFVQIGLLPNTEWLKDTIKLSARGEIEVDARGQTSLPGVFAAGDVTTVPYKQIVIAMGEGSKAALGAFDHLIRVSAPEAEQIAA